MTKRSKEEFYNLVNERHNYKYKYFNDYIFAHAKIKIECFEHGQFMQSANAHLRGQGCPMCGREKISIANSKSKELFTIDANLKHNNKYNYPEEYIKSNIHINIECPKHGLFKQTPNAHLNGEGCGKCADEYTSSLLRKTHEDFVKESNKIHNFRYNYPEMYKNNATKIKIECKIHGIFEQNPNHHLTGCNCPRCSKTYKLNNGDFLKKANEMYNNKYKYITKYKTIKDYIIIECPTHGQFEQTAEVHLRGNGCNRCSLKNISKSEIKWLDYMCVPKEFRQVSIVVNNRKFKCDAFDPNENIIYEYYGDFWHGNPAFFKAEDINPKNKITFGELYKNTLEKENVLKSAGYNIVYIWENNWNNIKSE